MMYKETCQDWLNSELDWLGDLFDDLFGDEFDGVWEYWFARMRSNFILSCSCCAFCDWSSNFLRYSSDCL
jgi:hypothetical protein